MSKPLAIDLFCGLGGWTEGLLAEGYDVIGFDIEAHEYGEERYPAKLVLQDVLTLDGAQFKDAALIVASPPCFVADTLILTARGLVPIPDVVVGDLVLTHRKRWRRVLRTGSTVSPTLLAIGYGGSLEGTTEHPIYARENDGGFSVWDKTQKAPVNIPKRLSNPTWTPLGEMEGRHWASPTEFDPLPVPQLPNGLKSSREFWWIVGRWLGDGWVRLREDQGDEVIICCSFSEADELEEQLNGFAPRQGARVQSGEIHWRRSNERTTTRFTAASNSLARWLVEHFGRGAAMKSLPAWTLGMPQEHREGLLAGYVSADGSTGKNGGANVIRASSVSKRLALSVRLLAASLGFNSNLFYTRRPPTSEIEGRTISQQDTWTASWNLDATSRRLVERDNGLQWGKVRDVSNAQKSARVWNIEVEEDNSYTANGIVVHNCQEYSYMAMPWSRAKAKAAAIRADDTGEALARLTALFDACFRIQREAIEAAGRHIPLLVENVRGAEPWVGRAKWSFGSYYLWGDVPALMPATIKARKNPGFRFDGSGRSFQSESVARHVDGLKAPGGAHRLDGAPHTARLTNPAEGRKGAGAGAGAEWFAQNLCSLPSKSPRRKAASAKIAKIPFALSSWIARTYKPQERAAPAHSRDQADAPAPGGHQSRQDAQGRGLCPCRGPQGQTGRTPSPALGSSTE